MKTSPTIEAALHRAASLGIIKPRTENNPYLKVSYQGTGNPITEKWNIKIYSSGSLVTNDTGVVRDLVEGKALTSSPNLQVLSIDDAGWGSPVGGVMVGISDGATVITDTLGVEYFKGVYFERKHYLKGYSLVGQELLKRYKPSPSTHCIEICTGHINTTFKEDLRRLGYDVRVTEIKGLLQDTLEGLFKDYIQELTGADLAYDPKALKAWEIASKYRQAVDYARQHCPELLKAGWKSLKKEGLK